MCNLQKRMETSFLWLANSFFFCIGHFSKRRSRSSFASNFYPIITLCLTDCWNCLARGLILVPNSMYCLLEQFFGRLFFAVPQKLRSEQKIPLLLSSWKLLYESEKKQKYIKRLKKNAKIASVENSNNCFLKEIGNLKQFSIKKSDKIGKSLNSIH